MRHDMIRILAIAALLLMAGSFPGNADAGRPARMRVTQSTKFSPGYDTFTAKGSGFLPNLALPGPTVQVDFTRCYMGGSCDPNDPVSVPANTDSRGNWETGQGFPCDFQTMRVSASDGTNTVGPQTLTAAC